MNSKPNSSLIERPERAFTSEDLYILFGTSFLVGIASYSESLPLYASQAILLTFSSIYFVRRHHPILAFFLPATIPLVIMLFPFFIGGFLSLLQGSAQLGFFIGFGSSSLFKMLTESASSIAITYLCLLVYYFGFELGKKSLPGVPDRK